MKNVTAQNLEGKYILTRSATFICRASSQLEMVIGAYLASENGI
jgi:hypothetical protein